MRASIDRATLANTANPVDTWNEKLAAKQRPQCSLTIWLPGAA
jgi:hypothetical protein